MAETKTLQEILLTLGEKPLNVNVNLPGIKGENGQDGRNGADGLSAYDIAQLEGFTGTRKQWLDSLKAGAIADEARTMLLNGNVWCKSNSIADVLAAVISNLGKAFPRTEFKPLTVPTVFRGQRAITVGGEPHYFVKVADMETQFEIGDNGECVVSIEPLGEDDVKLTYHNFTGNKVSEYTIRGIADENAAQPDEVYDELGSKYSKYGRKLVINVTGQKTDNEWYRNNFNFFGKWNEQDFDSIEIVTNGKKKLTLYLKIERPGLPNVPIFVNKPEFIRFQNLLSPTGNTTISIGSKEYGTTTVNFIKDVLEWSNSDNRYINTGEDPL
nr:MAG TPA: hypothetical protein [Caudoviricetes sp.]